MTIHILITGNDLLLFDSLGLQHDVTQHGTGAPPGGYNYGTTMAPPGSYNYGMAMAPPGRYYGHGTGMSMNIMTRRP